MPLREIVTRRSIRSYRADAVTEEQFEHVLRAAMAAPSAGNQQPWEFIVLTDRDLLANISEIHPYSKMQREAPAAIVICGNMSRVKHRDFWGQDCSAAVENMLLEATHQGLGSLWLGIYPRQDHVDTLKQVFKLPEPIVPFAIVALGYAHDQSASCDRFNSAYIHRNRW